MARKQKLKPLGKDSLSYRHGYDLPLIVGHLESLVGDEADTNMHKTFTGKRAERLRKCEDALQLLNEVVEHEPEDED